MAETVMDAGGLPPTPPAAFLDGEGRRIELLTEVDAAALRGMYRRFKASDRAQGIPPAGEPQLRIWVEGLIGSGVHLLARHDGRVIGHAALVPIDDSRSELIVFVVPEYQGARIGSTLVQAICSLGRERGVERVWLTVERDNYAAINCYRAAGFETTARGRELEMEREL